MTTPLFFVCSLPNVLWFYDDDDYDDVVLPDIDWRNMSWDDWDWEWMAQIEFL